MARYGVNIEDLQGNIRVLLSVESIINDNTRSKGASPTLCREFAGLLCLCY